MNFVARRSCPIFFLCVRVFDVPSVQRVEIIREGVFVPFFQWFLWSIAAVLCGGGRTVCLCVCVRKNDRSALTEILNTQNGNSSLSPNGCGSPSDNISNIHRNWTTWASTYKDMHTIVTFGLNKSSNFHLMSRNKTKEKRRWKLDKSCANNANGQVMAVCSGESHPFAYYYHCWFLGICWMNPAANWMVHVIDK